MKKLAILFSILFITGMATSYAQSDSRGGLGLKGGLTFSTIGFDNEDAQTHKNRYRIGGMAGLGYEVKTEGFFTFELSALYDLRGTKEVVSFLDGNELIQKNYLHYLSFPANFKFYIGDNFNIHVGGYSAALLGGKARAKIENPDGDEVDSRDFNLLGERAQDFEGDDYLKRVDAGLQFGLEFISDGGIGIGSSFSKGLVDITHDNHIFGRGNARTTEVNVYVIFRL